MIKAILRFLNKKILSKVIYGGIRPKLLAIAGIIAILVVFGAFLASAYLNMTFNQGIWWTWTHMVDPGFIDGDGGSLVQMLVGSFIAFIGVLIVAGAFLTILQEIIEVMVEHLKKGHIAKSLTEHTVIAGTGAQLKNYITAVNSLSPLVTEDQLLIVISEQQDLERVKGLCPNHIPIAVDTIWTPKAMDRLSLKSASRLILLENFGGDISKMFKVITQLNSLRIEESPASKLKIYIEVNNRKLLPMLQSSLQRFIKHPAMIDVSLMNMANISARLALLEHPLEVFLSNKSQGQTVLVILGWSLFSDALLQQVLRVSHSICPTRIIIATNNTQEIQEKISQDYPGLSDTNYINKILSIECLDFNAINCLKTQSEDNVTFAICGENHDEVFSKAIELSISDFTGLQQIFVELPDGSGYIDVIQAMSFSDEDIPIIAVGSHAKAFELMEQLDKFAKQGHEKYIQQRELQGKRIKKANGTYENPADYSWEMLDEVHRGWNRSPADHAEIKLRTLAGSHQIKRHEKTNDGQIVISRKLKQKVQDILDHYKNKVTTHHKDLELLAMLEHNRWAGEKLAEGWIVGKETNKPRQISSFIIPYDKLSEEIKAYDRDQVVIQLTNLLVDAECIDNA